MLSTCFSAVLVAETCLLLAKRSFPEVKDKCCLKSEVCNKRGQDFDGNAHYSIFNNNDYYAKITN